MDGDRKYTLDELEDGASYVLSSLKVFKVNSKITRQLFGIKNHLKAINQITKYCYHCKSANIQCLNGQIVVG